MKRIRRLLLAVAALTTVALGLSACGGSSDKNTLTVYSGREEEIVAPLLAKFEAASGIKLDVRYGSSSELAAQLADEGDNSPADVFFAQDAGAIGSIVDRLAPLPATALDRIPKRYRDPGGRWIGTSGRSRVVAYNTKALTAADLPDRVVDYTDKKYRGRLGIAPTNASFQAFVTGMRLDIGDDKTRVFLNALKANDPKIYPKNLPIVEAIASGEIDLGLVNHYYLALLKAEQPDAPVANHFLTPGDPGALVNVAGIGILTTSKKQDAAVKFVDYLLSDEGQRFYTTESAESEYPLVAGVPGPAGLPPLAQLQGTASVSAVKLSDLGKEERATLEMLNEVGLTS